MIDWNRIISIADDDSVNLICGKELLYVTQGGGHDGRGIVSITKTATVGLVDLYTILYTDGTTSTFTVTNGSVGADGRGIVSITRTGRSGLYDTYTIVYTDDTTSYFLVKNGNGIEAIEKTATNEAVDTYTIYYQDGTTSTFDVTNGTYVISDGYLTIQPLNDNKDDEKEYFVPNVDAGQAKNVIIDFMASQSGSGTPSSSNIRPFVGVDKIYFASFSNKNQVAIANTSTVSGVTFTKNSDGTITITGTAEATADVDTVLSFAGTSKFYPATYVLTGGNADISLKLGDQVDSGSGATKEYAANTAPVIAISIVSGTTYDTTISPMLRMLNCGNSDFVKELYINQPTIITLNTFCYGGTYDAVTGKLLTTWGHIADYLGEELPGEWLSDRDEYRYGNTPSWHAEVIYKLAEPVESSYTPDTSNTRLFAGGTYYYIFVQKSNTIGSEGKITKFTVNAVPGGWEKIEDYLQDLVNNLHVGSGIVSITQTASNHFYDTYTILFEDDTTLDFHVSREVEYVEDTAYDTSVILQASASSGSLSYQAKRHFYFKVAEDLQINENTVTVHYPVQWDLDNMLQKSFRPLSGLDFAVQGDNYNLLTPIIISDAGAALEPTINDDKSITIAPEHAIMSGNTMTGVFTYSLVLPAGSYKILGGTTQTGTGPYAKIRAMKLISLSSWDTLATDTGSGATFTLTADTYVEVLVDLYDMETTYPWSAFTIYPMLVPASITPTEYLQPLGYYKSISFGSSIYGGDYDIATGKVTVTYGRIESYNGETLPGVWYSDRDDYAPNTVPTTGAVVIYELAQPQIIQAASAFESGHWIWEDCIVDITLNIPNGFPNNSQYIEIINRLIYKITIQDYVAKKTYSKAQSDARFAPISHNHDDRYYTETEINAALANKADITYVNGKVLAAEKTVASEFSTTQSYSIGDYVIYDDKLYRFTKNHSAGAWNAGQVVSTNVMDDLFSGGTIIKEDQSEIFSLRLLGTSSANKFTSLIYHYQPSLNGIASLYLYLCNRNLIQPTSEQASIYGVTFTTNNDGSISFSGTPTQDINVMVGEVSDQRKLPAGNYYLSGGIDANCYLYVSHPDLPDVKSTGNQVNFTLSSPDYVQIYAHIPYTGTSVSGTFYPMVRYADISDQTFIKNEINAYDRYIYYTVGYLYGGYWNLINGKVVKTHEHIASYNGETLPGWWMSDRDTYAPGTSPSIGASVTYELAEPVEYSGSSYPNIHTYDYETTISTQISYYNTSASTYISAEYESYAVGKITALEADKTDLDVVADEFSASTAYAIGDYVIYNGKLYRFTSAHAAGAWASGDVTEVIIGDELKRKQNTLTFDAVPTDGSTNPVESNGVYDSLALKAPLASPTFTGTPQITTTPTNTDNSHKIADTAYVNSHDDFKISGSVSSGGYTLTDARIDNEHWEVDWIYFETPSNVTTNISWSTNITNHTVTLSATYSAATNVIVNMHWVQ